MVNYKLYSNQRIGIFVDVQNFYYSAKQLYNAKVNFNNILKDAIKGRQLIRALAYVIKADVGAEKTFFDALDLMGYEVRSKDIQVFVGGAKKGDWDVGITMDCIALAQQLDVVVLCSGDGDFLPLVDFLQKAAGCRVEVMAFGKTTNKQLREHCDAFFDLCSGRYLIDAKGSKPDSNGDSHENHHSNGHHQKRYDNRRSFDRRDNREHRGHHRHHHRRSFQNPANEPLSRPPKAPPKMGGEVVPENSTPAVKKKATTKKTTKKATTKKATTKKTTKKATTKKATTKKTTKKKTTKKAAVKK